jgi:transposase-like protein
MDFPIQDLIDPGASYRRILDLLHPDGLACPRCAAREGLNVHRRRADSPVVDYRCKACRRVFNLFTGTAWQGTRLPPATILLILRGIAQGTSTAQLARELGLSRPHLLERRHEIQARALAGCDRSPLPDGEVEADEMYQNAGEKRHPARRPGRPAAAARQPGAGARDVGQRPSAGAGGGRPGGRAAVDAGGSVVRRRGVGRGDGGAGDAARREGVHRRVGGVQAAESVGPGARDGQPRCGGVRAG